MSNLSQAQIIIISVIFCFWLIIALISYFALNRTISKRYRKFYPHPVVGVSLELYHNNIFSHTEKVIINIYLIAMYLPIMLPWFICWCIYTLHKIVYMDDYIVNYTTRQEHNEQDENEKLAKHTEQFVDAMNNPECIDEQFMDIIYHRDTIKINNDKENITK